MVTADLFLLQQRQGIGQQCHPEAAGGDLGRHEREEQFCRFREALLSVQFVELPVLSWGWESNMAHMLILTHVVTQ